MLRSLSSTYLVGTVVQRASRTRAGCGDPSRGTAHQSLWRSSNDFRRRSSASHPRPVAQSTPGQGASAPRPSDWASQASRPRTCFGVLPRLAARVQEVLYAVPCRAGGDAPPRVWRRRVAGVPRRRGLLHTPGRHHNLGPPHTPLGGRCAARRAAAGAEHGWQPVPGREREECDGPASAALSSPSLGALAPGGLERPQVSGASRAVAASPSPANMLRAALRLQLRGATCGEAASAAACLRAEGRRGGGAAVHTSATSCAGAEAPACGAACATPTACSTPAETARDIAYKPAQSGWGYTKSYASGWDRIFGKKGDSAAATPQKQGTEQGATARPDAQ